MGKTTTAVSLGSALAALGKRVLVLDLDPHGCAGAHLGVFEQENTSTLRDIFLTEQASKELLKSIIVNIEAVNFDLAPGSVRLSELDVDLRTRKGRGFILRDLLRTIRKDYDIALVDCPPNQGVLLVNALAASDLTIIPIQTEYLALHGLKLIFDTIRTLNRVLNEPIKYMALATMYDQRAGACRKVLQLLQTKLGGRLFETVIPTDTKFRDASSRGSVIFKIAPHSRGSKAYMKLAKEILQL